MSRSTLHYTKSNLHVQIAKKMPSPSHIGDVPVKIEIPNYLTSRKMGTGDDTFVVQRETHCHSCRPKCV